MQKFIVLVLFVISNLSYSQSINYAHYVNPFIGTGGHGHTFPGASLPFGMVQLSPDTRIDGSWDGCSGYHYSDSTIYGFSHTHLSGTGVSDYGDIMLMPTMGKVGFDPKDYHSAFSHSNEKATAGLYSVKLDKHNIDVSLTTSKRVGFHQYTFNQSGQANIILDLNHRDQLLEGEVKIIDSKTVEVKRRSEAWARDQYVYALIQFDTPLKLTKIKSKDYKETSKLKYFKSDELALSFSKKVKKGDQIQVKVSLSFTSFEGARLNSSEIKHWDFDWVKTEATKSWNEELAKIEVKSSDVDKLTVFYTALYHTMIQPNIAQDLDGKYRGRDNQIHQTDGFDYYTVFSLWDTFRAAHPLYTLIDQKRTTDYLNTFIRQYEQGGRLPVWELASNETGCMIGYHSVSVLADAMIKGITGFDYEKAFKAAKHSAMLDHLGLKSYKENGFISMDDEHESVSKTLEYAYDDWCIAQMAFKIGKMDDYNYFMNRSQYWKNLFDKKTKFMRTKKNGGWLNPFDPREVNNNFTEGNSWQYSFFVPQDINGMIEAYGGAEKFEEKLDEMFSSDSKTTGREQADITGLIGQYAHGNEPSHHMVYLYNYVGKPEKTKEKVHFILSEFYKNSPDGLIGNEDCGQMSAWYVLSSMGIYAVTPGKLGWTTTKPYFDEIKINFENGTSKIITKNTPKSELEKLGFEHQMDTVTTQIIPKTGQFITVPTIESEGNSFVDEMIIKIESTYKQADIQYTIKENGIISEFVPYAQPFKINQSYAVLAKAVIGNESSNVVQANFYKKPNNYTIELKSQYNPQYHAGGPEGLIDGIHGTENWRKGEWQGYQSQDFEAIVDLQEIKPIHSISSTYLQDTRSWILIPTSVEYYISTDNIHYELVAKVNHTVDPKNYESIIQNFEYKLESQTGRYIKVKAVNFGKLPEWHQGFPFNGEAFIFIDEITIK